MRPSARPFWLAAAASALCVAAWALPPAAASAALPSPPAAASPPPAPAAPGTSTLVGQVVLQAGTTYHTDIAQVAGGVVVDGRLDGSIALVAGQVSVGPTGLVTGAVTVRAGQLRVAPGGGIEGRVQVGPTTLPRLVCPVGGSPCTLAGAGGLPGTAVTTRVVGGLGCLPPLVGNGARCGGLGWRSWLAGGLPLLFAGWLHAGLRLLSFLGALALALPVAALWPTHVDGVRREIEAQAGWSALIGLAAVVAAVPVFAIVAITIIGIPVALAAVLALVGAWFFGHVAVVLWLGSRTAGLAHNASPSALWAIVLGSALLFVIGWIPVLGGLVGFAAGCVGLGAVLRSRFGTHRPWLPPRAGAGPVPPPPPPDAPSPA